MDRMYMITGMVIETRPDGYRSHREVPTFFLSANLQGILSEEAACRVGFHVVAPNSIPAQSEMHVSTNYGRMATMTTTTTDDETVIVTAMEAG
jgi:hypothetical protein